MSSGSWVAGFTKQYQIVRKEKKKYPKKELVDPIVPQASLRF